MDTLKGGGTCPHPENVGYLLLDSCSLERIDGDKGVEFVDITEYKKTDIGAERNTCNRDLLFFDLYNLKKDSIKPFSSFFYDYQYEQKLLPNEIDELKIKFEEAGLYRLKMRTVTQAYCIDTFSTDFTIHPRPTIALRQNDINLNCTKSDTTLIAVLDSLQKGTGNLIYEWKKNEIDIDSNKQFFIQDSSWANVDTVGFYTVKVIDSLKCSYQKPLNVNFPLVNDFRYSQVCEPTDSITFIEKGTSAFKLIEWKWNLGDGTEKIITDTSTYTHKYANQDDYTVKLSLKDSTGCTTDTSFVIYNTFPINRFSVNPILAKTFCQEGNVFALGNYPDSILFSQEKSHIDYIYWSWNEVKYNYGTDSLRNDSLNIDLSDGYELNKVIDKNLDTLNIKYTIEYNKHPEMGITKSCKREKSISKLVDEKIAGVFVVNGNCTKDTLSVKFKPSSQSKITSWNWSFKNANTVIDGFTSSNDSIPRIPIPKKLKEKSYDIYLTTTDENGCYQNFNELPITTTTISDVDSVSLIIDKLQICLGEPIKITSFEIGNPNSFVNTYYVLNNTTNDTIIGSKEFLNFKTNYDKAFLNQYTTPFLQEGKNKISLYVTQANIINNDTTYCGAHTLGEITVYPAPDLAFEYESVCAKDSITLINKSTIKIDTIISWNWTLPNGTITEEKHPSFTSDKGGANNISLEVTTKFGCSNKGENKLDTTVYFYHTPVVDFTINTDILEANIDLPFESTSYVDGTNEDIDSSTFDLGDGIFTEETTFLHNYSEIAIYNVTHKVISNKGCKAEITKKVNLNTYLNIPTSFSPNNDGKNDDFGLIHKEIKDLQEYKIYNRWGELVFDGGNDVNARWDGTFRGKNQEVGVYILYVKASGAYDQEYNFKENITLIR